MYFLISESARLNSFIVQVNVQFLLGVLFSSDEQGSQKDIF
jgi:hypothetical protein